MRGQTKGKECKGYVQGRDYTSQGVNVFNGLDTLSKTPVCLPGIDAKVQVKEAVALLDVENVDLSFFKKLVDHGHHPVVLINSEWGEEPLSWVEEYPIQWREPRVDLAELARLRWIEGFSTQELMKRYGRTQYAIENYYQNLRRKGFQVPGLSRMEISQILIGIDS